MTQQSNILADIRNETTGTYIAIHENLTLSVWKDNAESGRVKKFDTGLPMCISPQFLNKNSHDTIAMSKILSFEISIADAGSDIYIIHVKERNSISTSTPLFIIDNKTYFGIYTDVVRNIETNSIMLEDLPELLNEYDSLKKQLDVIEVKLSIIEINNNLTLNKFRADSRTYVHTARHINPFNQQFDMGNNPNIHQPGIMNQSPYQQQVFRDMQNGYYQDSAPAGYNTQTDTETIQDDDTTET